MKMSTKVGLLFLAFNVATGAETVRSMIEDRDLALPHAMMPGSYIASKTGSAMTGNLADDAVIIAGGPGILVPNLSLVAYGLITLP